MARSAAARAEKPHAKPRAKPRASIGATPGWVVGLLAGAVIALAPALAVAAGVMLCPGLAMHVMERAPGKPAARAMLLFGAAACVGPIRSIWQTAAGTVPALATAGTVVTDPRTLAIAWLAGGAGWLVHEVAPVLTRLVIERAEAARVSRLTAARAAYEAEWDLPAQ